MRQRARQLLVPLFVLLAVACGTQQSSGIRVSQAERVLGPKYQEVVHEASMNVVLFGESTVKNTADREEFARKMVEEKVRIKMEQDAAEEAARVKAEAERVAAEEAETARAAAEEAQAAKRARAASVAATSTTIVRVAVTTPVTTPVKSAPVASSGNTSGVDIDCESGSNYAKNTGNGYYGAYQWLQSTFDAAVSLTDYADWAGTLPSQAPAYVQDAAAAAWVAAGHRNAWPHC